MKDLSQRFLDEISRIKDPLIFLGVCKATCTEIYVKKDTTKEADVEVEEGVEERVDCAGRIGGTGAHDEPRPFGELLRDVMAHYSKASRKFKRDMLRILRSANSSKETFEGEIDASNSEDS